MAAVSMSMTASKSTHVAVTAAFPRARLLPRSLAPAVWAAPREQAALHEAAAPQSRHGRALGGPAGVGLGRGPGLGVAVAGRLARGPGPGLAGELRRGAAIGVARPRAGACLLVQGVAAAAGRPEWPLLPAAAGARGPPPSARRRASSLLHSSTLFRRPLPRSCPSPNGSTAASRPRRCS